MATGQRIALSPPTVPDGIQLRNYFGPYGFWGNRYYGPIDDKQSGRFSLFMDRRKRSIIGIQSTKLIDVARIHPLV